MSTSIDERVVKMEFDDSGFSSGADRAIGILDKLKQSMNFESATSGLSTLKKTADTFSLDSISDSIGVCSDRFSAFETFVAGIFLRLGSRAADFGTNMVRNLSVRAMTDGFSEYELQMRSIQTILSNTGDKLKDQGYETQEAQIGVINERLDELNEYADQTIYNFSQMTRNIGLFTAAGVDLDTAVSAIQGISNLAAASGADNAAAGRAMYNLSQAISTGTVRLIDWNSVVNAGMGGELFQNALKRTARAHGVAVDEIIEKQGSFRESLSEGWLTADILTDTLEQLTIQIGDVGYETREAGIETLKAKGYTEEEAEAILDLAENAYEAATKVRTWKQLWETVGEALGSGWAQSWRIIVGDFLQATELFTWFSDRISGMINESADERNKFLQTWADIGGREALFNGIKNIFTSLQIVFEAISDSFDAVFGILPSQLLDATKAFETFTEKLILSEEDAIALAGIFDTIFALLKDSGKVIFDVASYFAELAVQIGKSFEKANAFERIVNIVKTISDAIFIPLNAIGTAFAEVFDIDDSLSDFLSGPIDFVLSMLESLSESLVMSEESAKKLHDAFKSFFDLIRNGFDGSIFSNILSFFSGIVENVKNSGVIDSIKEFFASIDFGKVGETASIGLLGAGLFKLVSTIKGILDGFKVGGEGGIKDKIIGLIDGLKEAFSSFTEAVKIGQILGIAIAIGILAGSLVALSTIPADKMVSSVALLSSAFGELVGGFVLFSKATGGNGTRGIGSMVLMAAAVWILSKALKSIADLDWDDIGRGLTTVGGLLAELIIALRNMPDSGKILSSSIGMLIMSFAIGSLALSMKLLATMNLEQIGIGLAAIGGLLLEFMIALNNMPDSGKILSASAGMLLMSIAIGALSLSMKLISTMSWEQIGQGLIAIGTLLIGFMTAMNNMPDSGKILSTALAMVAMSIAIGSLALSMKLLATMSWEELGNGLVAIGLLLLGFMVALNNMPDSGRILSSAAAMLIMSVSIGALAVSLKLLSTMSLEELGAGLIVIAGLLISIGVALAVFQANIGGALAMGVVAVSILVLVAALNLLVPAIQALSQLSIGEVGVALLALGGALLVVGGVAALLSLAVAPTLGFAAAMLMFAAAAYLVAKAVAILADVFGPVIPGLIEAGGNIINGIIEGITGAASGLADIASNIGSIFLNGVKNFFGIHSPSTVMEGIGGNVIQGLINGLDENSAPLEAQANDISSIITGATEGLPSEFSMLGTDAMGNLSSALSEGSSDISGSIEGMIPGASDAMGNLSSVFSSGSSDISGSIESMVSGVSKSSKGLSPGLKTQATLAMTSFRGGIKAGANGVKADFAAIVSAASSGIAPLSGKLKAEATKAMSAFSSSIRSGASSVKSAMSNVVSSASGSTGSLYNQFHGIGKNAVQGLINGIDSLLGRARSKADELTRVVTKVVKAGFAVKSPSRVFMGIGQNVVQGLINGIDGLIPDAAGSAADLSSTVIDSFGNTLGGMAIGLDDLLDTDLNPVITPVINSAEFDSNLQRLSAMMNSRLSDSIDIGSVNYNETFAGKLDAVADINKQAMQQFAENAIDYDLLGVSVANALIRSGVHVEMDGGQLMGYIAGEINDVRRMNR